MRGPVRRMGLALCLTAISWAFAAPGALADFGRAEFSAKERERLDRGRLVTRPMSDRRGSLQLIGGTSWQVVDLRPGAVWRALRDVARYPKMLPEVRRARSVETQAGFETVFIEHRGGVVDVSYHVNMRFQDDGHQVFFQLDPSRPGSLRAAWGFLRVKPWRDGRSLLSFGVMADVGNGILSGLLRPLVHEWMLKVPWTVKKYVEGSGRKRYAQVPG